ncbi:MAG: Glu/Leu/Phe/Val dehydrogenase dimerization domain-containing protein [Propionibacteriaceae bacterium]|nr:Glu/Leu/Phe/Val dehydrogenase dimerization domain-containing protein [Propionibacteriaceae bacterium]
MTRPTGPDLFATEQVITCRDDEVGLRAVIAIDDTTLGPGFGGVRWRPYPSTAAAVAEAQRLASAMTLKHALAELPYGGAKSVIIADGPVPAEGSPERAAVMRRYADFLARTAGSYIPGVDMGTLVSDMQLIREHGAPAYCADVDPGAYTARGVYAAMRAGVRHALGRDMAGVRVAVQGVGHVGTSLARYAARDGAVVTVADVDGDRAASLAHELGGTVGDPATIAESDCDVFAPCAVARVVSAGNVDRIRARVVAGAANDTLDAPEVADLLRERGITFVPDFIANAGGVLQVHGGEVGWDDEELGRQLERIGDRVAEVLAEADEQDITPVAAALRRADRRLQDARDRSRA